jgi:uncharacterized peroxidase-related enzyme
VNVSKKYTLRLAAQHLSSESAQIRSVLEQAKQQVGFIPNMYARMVNSPGLLETYLFGYARFRTESGFTPAEQEVVFLTISRENGCHYCIAAHSTLADAVSGVPVGVTDAIRDGAPIPDPRLRALSEFTRVLLTKRGRPDRHDVVPFLAAGYTERQILEIVLAISVKTLSNWANHLFDTPVDDMFARRAWSAVAETTGAA